MATEIRKGTPTGTVLWSDGTLFSGILWIGLKSMLDGTGSVWPSFAIGHQGIKVQYPVWAPVPINDGQFDPSIGVLWNADLNPPNTQYIAYYYDANGKQVAGPSAAFQVTSSTFTVPSLTLTNPTVGSNPIPN